MESAPAPRRRWRRLLALLALPLAILAGLFLWTGLRTGWTAPEIVTEEGIDDAPWSGELTLVALNLAKLDFHRGGLDFAPAVELEDAAADVARAIENTNADVVCLSEVVESCGLTTFDQVRALARLGGFPHRVYVPNYDFGVPGLRVSAGNAILSRFPLREARGQQLAGERPFWAPTNNRRAAWCEVKLGETWVRLASIRNDSYDLENNAAQVEELLAELDGEAAVLAGDFNATPDSGPGRLWRSAPALAALEGGAPTFPAHDPRRRIDDAVWPADWELLHHGVLDTGRSDHLGVVFRWRVDAR